jgi:hypothetical protein
MWALVPALLLWVAVVAWLGRWVWSFSAPGGEQ